MVLRFRKRVTLFPGVRLNLGKRGVSISTGVRGANLTLGRHGLYGNVGLPGSGLSYRTRLGDPRHQTGGWRGGAGRGDAEGGATAEAEADVRVVIEDDGRLRLRDRHGNVLPARLERSIRRERGEALRAILEEERDARNGDIGRLLDLHVETPAEPIVFTREGFAAASPRPPALRPIGLLGRIFRSRREAIERENEERQERHRRQVAAWETARRAHESKESERETRFRLAQACLDREAMEELLEQRLSEIDWPRETEVSYQVTYDRAAVLLDVALPAEEEMPGQEASLAARGFKLNVREKSPTQRRREYARHVHAALLRVTGEVFATLPVLERVVVSGGMRRPDPATGRPRSCCLLSAVVERDAWEHLDLNNLDGIDPVVCFEQFELRRDMTRTGILREVEAFELADALS